MFNLGRFDCRTIKRGREGDDNSICLKAKLAVALSLSLFPSWVIDVLLSLSVVLYNLAHSNICLVFFIA